MTSTIRRTAAATIAALAVAVAVAGCGSTPQGVNQKDTNSTANQLDTYQRSQPIPFFNFSAIRQTLINVEGAEAHATATTSFFFALGSTTPYMVCPSLGFPVPATTQLSNPQQTALHGDNGITSIGQMEPTGVYPGDTTGTFVVCVHPDGSKGIDYAEGQVHTVGGPAHWDHAAGQIVTDGAATVTTASK